MQAERIVVYFPKESLPTSKRHPREECTRTLQMMGRTQRVAEVLGTCQTR